MSIIQSLDLDDNDYITLKTSNITNKNIPSSFTIFKKYAFISDLIKTAFSDETKEVELSLNLIDNTTMYYIIDFMNYCKGDDTTNVPNFPLTQSFENSFNDKWFYHFINNISSDPLQIGNLIKYSDYLCINSLLHMCCAQIASVLQKNPVDKFNEIMISYFPNYSI
jgi:hypothetical protein